MRCTPLLGQMIGARDLSASLSNAAVSGCDVRRLRGTVAREWLRARTRERGNRDALAPPHAIGKRPGRVDNAACTHVDLLTRFHVSTCSADNSTFCILCVRPLRPCLVAWL